MLFCCAFRFECLVASLISCIPLSENKQHPNVFYRARQREAAAGLLCLVPPKQKPFNGTFLLCWHFQQLDLELDLTFGTRSPLDLVLCLWFLYDTLQAVLHLMKMYGSFIAWQLDFNALHFYFLFFGSVSVGWPAGYRNIHLQSYDSFSLHVDMVVFP